MASLLFRWTVLGLFMSALLGCRNPCCRVHGICDCFQTDPCATRAPWAMPDSIPSLPLESGQELPKIDKKKL